MSKHFVILAIISCICFTSCKHYCATNPYPIIDLSRFDSAELNTVIVRSHDANGALASTIETNIYTSRTSHSADTLQLYTTDSAIKRFVHLGFFKDATVEIPAIHRTYTIRGLAVNHDSWESVHCTNSMRYYVDDVQYTQPMLPYRNAQGIITLTK